jgi:hypothetical protein
MRRDFENEGRCKRREDIQLHLRNDVNRPQGNDDGSDNNEPSAIDYPSKNGAEHLSSIRCQCWKLSLLHI